MGADSSITAACGGAIRMEPWTSPTCLFSGAWRRTASGSPPQLSSWWLVCQDGASLSGLRDLNAGLSIGLAGLRAADWDANRDVVPRHADPLAGRGAPGEFAGPVEEKAAVSSTKFRYNSHFFTEPLLLVNMHVIHFLSIKLSPPGTTDDCIRCQE